MGQGQASHFDKGCGMSLQGRGYLQEQLLNNTGGASSVVGEGSTPVTVIGGEGSNWGVWKGVMNCTMPLLSSKNILSVVAGLCSLPPTLPLPHNHHPEFGFHFHAFFNFHYLSFYLLVLYGIILCFF